MFFGRSWKEWINEYELGHQNPINKLTHLFGIPLIAASLPLMLISIAFPGVRYFAFGMFILGWILQFVGHAFEGKPPEFMKDWRFLFVGLRWWFAKLMGKA